MRAHNSFTGGLNQDVSKHLIDASTLVDSFQVEILNREGSNFSATCMNGTTLSFTLASGYKPKAVREYNGLLYIVSVNDTTRMIEFGSYTSPSVPVVEAGVPEADSYRAFQNLDGGAMRFNLSIIGVDDGVLPDFIDIELQQDYDDSVNIVITSSEFFPTLINSGFEYRENTFYDTERLDYTVTDLLDQIKLILNSNEAMSISFQGVNSGGELTTGSYIYYFSYLTQDLNETNIVNQSSLCQVFQGDGDYIKGDTDTGVSGKRIGLQLTGLDTSFSYVQPYFTFISGDETPVKQTVKFNIPIKIDETGALNFVHNGLESVTAVSTSELGLNLGDIQSARSVATNKGYLFLANTSEANRIEQSLADYAKAIRVRVSRLTDQPVDFYKDPKNVYESLGYFSGETYCIYAVFKYKSGGFSPAFPTEGYDYVNNEVNEKGLVRPPTAWDDPFFTEDTIDIKRLIVAYAGDKSTISELVQEVFLVRAERQNSSLVDQGIVLPSITVTQSPNRDFANVLSTLTLEQNRRYVPTMGGIVEAYSDSFTASPDGSKDGDLFYRMSPTTYYPGEARYFVQNPNAWGFYSTKLLSNSSLTAATISQAKQIRYMGDVKYEVQDNSLKVASYPNPVPGVRTGSSTDIGTRYEVDSVNHTPLEAASPINIEQASYITRGSRQTGMGMISAVDQAFSYLAYSNLEFMPFVGIETRDGEPLMTKGPGNCLEWGEGDDIKNDGGLWYQGDPVGNKYVRAALVSLYSEDLLDVEDYYPNVDSLAFNQIGERYNLQDLSINTKLVYGGDCFIGKNYYTLHHSPYLDPTEDSSTTGWDNNNCGFAFSFIAEADLNPHLRTVYTENETDLEERTFYPFRKNYREKRYADSQRINPGYGYDETDVDFFPNPVIIPDVKSNFFTRVFSSSKHIPNSFQNGYRLITNGFQDYDTSMGAINKIFGYGNDLLIVFEHGVGATPINQRVQTGGDVAGDIFIKPSEVLSDQLGTFSYSVGSQHPYSVMKTNHHIYGVDAQEGKIWRVSPNGLEEISEGVISSKIQGCTNPRTGYDPINKLVYFASDQWCYVYAEKLGKFISTSDNRPPIFAKVPGKGMYGFVDGQAHLYEESDTLYEDQYQPMIEFVVNENFNVTKVFDYINIYSNNQSPSTIEFYTLNYDGTINQEATLTAGTDFWTDDETIKYRDKKYVAQIPRVTGAEYKELDWGLDNRLRDKYVIVRVTYDLKNFELNLIGTEYRISNS